MATTRTWIGVDIGGANLKAATSDGRAASRAFPLWKYPERLATALAGLLARLEPFDAVAVTMSGELADCYRDRGEGVRRIIHSTQRAVGGRHTRFFTVDGSFLAGREAIGLPDAVAAANWRASAQWLAGQYPHGRSLVIDVGSTTCDLTPLENGVVGTTSRTDFDRLGRGELVYLGAERTPICSLVDHLPFRGGEIPVMREVFATIADCAVLTNRMPQDGASGPTADGRPQTIPAALNRLARMVGLDHRTVTLAEAQMMAERPIAEARRIVAAAIQRFGQCDRWIAVGHGTWLLPTNPPCPLESPASDPLLARVAPAHALAVLAEQQ